MHGKMSKIIHNKKDLFKNMPSKIYGTRYHSLIIEKKVYLSVLKLLQKQMME